MVTRTPVTRTPCDDEGRERLCRYGARPPFSLERLSLLPDGRVAYRLRRPRRNGVTRRPYLRGRRRGAPTRRRQPA